MKLIKTIGLQMLAAIACICIYSSCSGDDYINAIPASSNALVAIDTKALNEQTGMADNNVVKSLLKVDNVEDCGIDFSSKLYLFETADGNLGFCAKVDSKSTLADWLDSLYKKGLCSKTAEKRGFSFALLKGSWAVGFSDESAVIIGPVLPAQQAEAIRTLGKYLKQDEDDGIKSTPMFDKVDSIKSPVTIVAQVDALPEKLAAPFTIGAPKGADNSQICIAASLTASHNGCMNICGEPFSFNPEVDKALKASNAKFRKIKGTYAANLPGNTLCSIFMNVNGRDFVDMMHNSASLGVLLAGMNTAIDMDNILRCVDGEMVFGIDAFSDKNISMSMAAQLAKTDFLKDVDYWKKSCQPGSSITDCGKNSFVFKSDDAQFWLGASATREFYGSSKQEIANSILKPAKRQLPSEVRKDIVGKRFCMVANVGQMIEENKDLSLITDLLKPLFGNVNYIVYSIK